MYESKIVSAEVSSARLADRIRPLHNMMAVVAGCIGATGDDAASQDDGQPDIGLLAARYAQAGSIARRRVDALVHEAEVESLAGCGLIARRGDRAATGTAAAAHFLHRRMRDTFSRIDRLLPLAA